jgi:hypothetical protein
MINAKQKGALTRLEAQIKSGEKTVKGTKDQKEPLTAKDITRINQEIKRLRELDKK